MVKVWVLLAYITTWAGYGAAGGPIAVSDLATKQECERMVRNFKTVAPPEDVHAVCVEVWKKVP